MCDKRPFPSVKQARQACHKNSLRIRVYLCPDCHRYHVTKDVKGWGRQLEEAAR